MAYPRRANFACTTISRWLSGTMIGTGCSFSWDDWLWPWAGPAGSDPRVHPRWNPPVARGLCLRPMGTAAFLNAAGERPLYRQFFLRRKLLHGMDGCCFAYFIVCPWEAVALGKKNSSLHFSLPSIRLPALFIAGHPVFLPRLILGIALTLLLATINYRGIRPQRANFPENCDIHGLASFLLMVGNSVCRSWSTCQFFQFPYFFPRQPSLRFLFFFTLQNLCPILHDRVRSFPSMRKKANPELFVPKDYMKAIGMGLGVGAISTRSSITCW